MSTIASARRALSGAAANTAVVLGHRPDMVGFSATTSGFLDGYAMAEQLKRANPAIVTVFGGVHVSSLGAVCPATLLPHRLPVPGGRRGDPGATWPTGGRPTTFPVWPGAAAIRRWPTRPVRRIPDLDSLPFPAYEKLRLLSGAVPSSAVQLHPNPRGDHDHQPGLPLPLLLLRPIGVQAQLPVQLGRVRLRAPEVPAAALRGPPRQHLRRPVHHPAPRASPLSASG